MWGGAIPSSAYKQGIGVAFKQPVIILHVSFRAMSTCPVYLERPHEEQAYSAVEKQSANAVVRTVLNAVLVYICYVYVLMKMCQSWNKKIDRLID